MSIKDITGLSEQLVWYAGYGSNLNADRLACYIEGGRPNGSKRTYEGCADTRPPRATMAVELPYELYFAGESPVWGGGFALIDDVHGAPSTKSRASLITLDQFEQIAMQESRRSSVKPIHIETLRLNGRQLLGDASYDLVLYCGDCQNVPVLTLTRPSPLRPYAKPSLNYLRTIIAGLQQTHAMTPGEIRDYLITKPGITNEYTDDQLDALLGLSLSSQRRNTRKQPTLKDAQMTGAI